MFCNSAARASIPSRALMGFSWCPLCRSFSLRQPDNLTFGVPPPFACTVAIRAICPPISKQAPCSKRCALHASARGESIPAGNSSFRRVESPGRAVTLSSGLAGRTLLPRPVIGTCSACTKYGLWTSCFAPGGAGKVREAKECAGFGRAARNNPLLCGKILWVGSKRRRLRRPQLRGGSNVQAE
jgi:hypothetical protein